MQKLLLTVLIAVKILVRSREVLIVPRRGQNIYRRKDGRWEGRYHKGRENGKLRYGYVYAGKYADVRKKLDIIEKEMETEKSIREKPPENSFGRMADEWLLAVKPQLKESSLTKYRNILSRHLKPVFGESDIESITRDEVDVLIRKLMGSGGEDSAGLSPGTVQGIISVLKNILNYANQKSGLKTADISRISICRKQRPMRILSREEQNRIAGYIYENRTPSNTGILLSMYTGLRIGELCALRWEDFNVNERCIVVNKTMQRIQKSGENGRKTGIVITPPKSESSIRKIPVSDELYDFLVRERRADGAYIASGMADSPAEPRTMQNRFKNVLLQCGIEPSNFHALRHTFATRCIEMGFDVKSLSEILGHANVNITMNRYVHPSMELKRKNMEKITGLFAVKKMVSEK